MMCMCLLCAFYCIG